MAVGEGADAHWAAVSRATQLEGAWRGTAKQERKQRRRVSLGLWLVRCGLRLAKPLPAEALSGPLSTNSAE